MTIVKSFGAALIATAALASPVPSLAATADIRQFECTFPRGHERDGFVPKTAVFKVDFDNGLAWVADRTTAHLSAAPIRAEMALLSPHKFQLKWEVIAPMPRIWRTKNGIFERGTSVNQRFHARLDIPKLKANLTAGLTEAGIVDSDRGSCREIN